MTKDQIKFRDIMNTIHDYIPDLGPGDFLSDFFNNVIDKTDPNIKVLSSSTDTLNRLLDNNALSATEAKTLININNDKVKDYLTNHINEVRLKELGSALGVGGKKTIDDIIDYISAELSNTLRNISKQKRIPKTKVLLETSVNKDKFNKTFHYKNKYSLSSGKNQRISIYALEFESSAFKFNQEDMFQILKDNLISYVNSKIKNNKLNMGQIGIETLQKILKKESILKDKSNQLSEMLLYIFLEASLDAPKLMSKIQLDDTGKVAQSDGIHIHRLPDINSEPQFDVIFGSSYALNDLKGAIDNAFEKVVRIEKQSEKEIRLLSEEVLDYCIPNAVDIKTILLPQPEDASTRPLRGKNAYGIFVAYTFNLDTSKPNIIKAFKEQYESDLIIAKDYIINKITTLKLNNYSFYIYLLPLNNVDETKAELLNKLMTGE